MTESEILKLKADVKELLSQALILLRNVPETESANEEDYNYRPYIKGSSEHREYLSDIYEDEELEEKLKDLPSEELVSLGCTKEVLSKLIKGEEDFILKQYYNSNC